ncbi:sensor domain-containing diguanylate cyclase [Pseudohongiella sp.]|uniref:Diguanylate cyclase n=1 Tax=marine sediment metagenome TaxID=412755 RepID=A0A0F9Z5S5_9ZZZZ|nr:CHASE domain-containing protein [Pseudohongiella sp.]HDZ09658.1 diguanylate cyclase [Pseudohongiella sp.]HEA61847.1 diguanylate cyclase [Pseudohongiella sp.]
MLDRKRTFSEKWLRVTRISSLVAGVLVVGTLLTLMAWRNAVVVVTLEDQDRFEEETSDSLELIRERMQVYGQVLRGVKGLFVASENVSREEFRSYTEELDLQQNYPGILGIAYALNIEPGRLEQHIAEVQAFGFPQYRVRPEGQRDAYSSILFIEPFSGNNLNAFGFDMYSERVRREAMDRARTSGTLALSGKVSLVQDVDRGPIAGVLLYLALYASEVTGAENNSDELLGWVYAPFSMDILMAGIQLDDSKIAMTIYDGTDPGVEAQLYSSAAESMTAGDLPFSRTEQLDIAQQTWTVSFAADAGFIQPHENTEPEAVLSIGALFTVLMAILTWALASGRERAEARAEVMNRELLETEFRWKSALSGAGHGVWDWNNLTNEVNYNTEWKSMLGYADDEIRDDFSEWQRLLHPLDRERAEATITDFISGKTKDFSLEHRLKTREGHWRWILGRGAIISRTEDGRPARTIGTHTDIDRQKSLELALSESDQRFRGAFESAAVGMALVGLAGEWLEVNQAILDMLQYDEDELLKLTFQDITHPDDLELDLQHLEALTAGKIPSYQMEKRYFCKDGSIIWIVLSASMVRDGNGEPLHYIAQIENITERKELQRRVIYQASHDDLTGLPNRRLLQERLAQTLALSRRHKRSFALMFIDVDHFKHVNDAYGHDVGDELLKWIAEKLSAVVRTSDTLARQGGDEFVLLLSEISAPEDATLVARKVFNAMRDEFDTGVVQLKVSLSVGIAIFDPHHPDSAEDLLRKADVALYQVKRSGRNDFQLYQHEDE